MNMKSCFILTKAAPHTGRLRTRYPQPPQKPPVFEESRFPP